jgi:transcriptional regulator with XRE-family HTH domain
LGAALKEFDPGSVYSGLMGSSSTATELGRFLRAHRALIDPADRGLPAGGNSRRVAGLRREELAVLAGISGDYYARLEQGRERNPSAQVLDAIGRVLQLDLDARGHLYRLAGLSPIPPVLSTRNVVHPSLLALLESFPTSAAYVLSPLFDVLATNSVAAALLSPFGDTVNMVRVMFCHPQAPVVFTEWDKLASATVHALRLNAGYFPEDQRIRDLVAEMTEKSPDFRAMWESQTTCGLTRAVKVFVHPDVGRVELTYQTFDVRDAPGQQLMVGTAVAGSASEDAVIQLTALIADRDRCPSR